MSRQHRFCQHRFCQIPGLISNFGGVCACIHRNNSDTFKAYIFKWKSEKIFYGDEKTVQNYIDEKNESLFSRYFFRKTLLKPYFYENAIMDEKDENHSMIQKFIKKLDRIFCKNFYSVRQISLPKIERVNLFEKYKKYIKKIRLYVSVYFAMKEANPKLFEKNLLALIDKF